MTEPGDLLRDTQLVADGHRPGRYLGAIPDAWRVMYAFGGVTMTASLRAMETHLARPDLQLVTANAIFCAPVPCGPVAVDVEVLRDGRSAAQVASDLFVPGTDGVALRTHGVFGRPHDTDLAFRDLEFPADVAPPAQCAPAPPRPADDPWPEINFHGQTEWLPALPFTLPDEATAGDAPRFAQARFAAWTRLRVAPLRPDGSYDMLALAVPSDSIGPAIGQGLAGRVRNFMSLSLEIGIRFIRPPDGRWVLQHMRCWHCGDGYATGPTELWDEHGNLLAIAQQTAHLRRPNFAAGA
ncbi:MAG TPA: thioesterase family protein [Acidimicrobiia bacterium]